MDRRAFLATAATTATALAGCLSDDDDAQLEAKNQTIAELEAELDAKNKTVADLDGQLVTKADQLEALENDLSAAKAKRDELRERLDDKHEAVETLEAEIEVLESDISALRPSHDFSDDEREQAREQVATVQDSTVLVDRGQQAAGFATEHGIVTVDHAFDDMDFAFSGPEVESVDGTREAFETTSSDSDADVRVLDSSLSLPSLSLSERTVNPGDAVVAVGHPFGVGFFVGSVGRVDDATGRGDSRRIAVDIPVAHGSSGSPVVTLDGDVIGMITHMLEDSSRTVDAPSEPKYDFYGYPGRAEVLPSDVLLSHLE